jgi:hypothetical protein
MIPSAIGAAPMSSSTNLPRGDTADESGYGREVSTHGIDE